jgi:hypothetical protein
MTDELMRLARASASANAMYGRARHYIILSIIPKFGLLRRHYKQYWEMCYDNYLIYRVFVTPEVEDLIKNEAGRSAKCLRKQGVLGFSAAFLWICGPSGEASRLSKAIGNAWNFQQNGTAFRCIWRKDRAILQDHHMASAALTLAETSFPARNA